MSEIFKYSIFSRKNKEIKNLKNGEKKWAGTGIYTYYSNIGPEQEIKNNFNFNFRSFTVKTDGRTFEEV